MNRITGRRLVAAVEVTIQAVSGADEGEVREGLREISQRLPARADLLGVEPEVIGVSQHFFEDQPGFVQALTLIVAGFVLWGRR